MTSLLNSNRGGQSFIPSRQCRGSSSSSSSSRPQPQRTSKRSDEAISGSSSREMMQRCFLTLMPSMRRATMLTITMPGAPLVVALQSTSPPLVVVMVMVMVVTAVQRRWRIPLTSRTFGPTSERIPSCCLACLHTSDSSSSSSSSSSSPTPRQHRQQEALQQPGSRRCAMSAKLSCTRRARALG